MAALAHIFLPRSAEKRQCVQVGLPSASASEARATVPGSPRCGERTDLEQTSSRCRHNCALLRSTVGYETWPYREARREIEPEKGCKGSASGKARAECSSAGRVAPPARGRAAKTGIRVPISAMAVDMPGLELCGEQSSPIYSGDLDSRQKPFRRNLAWSAP